VLFAIDVRPTTATENPVVVSEETLPVITVAAVPAAVHPVTLYAVSGSVTGSDIDAVHIFNGVAVVVQTVPVAICSPAPFDNAVLSCTFGTANFPSEEKTQDAYLPRDAGDMT